MKISKILPVLLITASTCLNVTPAKANDSNDNKSEGNSKKLPINNQLVFLVAVGVAIGIKVIADKNKQLKNKDVTV